MFYIIIGIVVFIVVLGCVAKLPRPECIGKKHPVCPSADNTDTKLKDVLSYTEDVPYMDEVAD